jgi:hypothetical protein
LIETIQSRNPLTPDIGPGTALFQAYRLATFALLAVQANSTIGASTLERENTELKEQISQLAARDATSLLNYVRSEFSISYTDPERVCKELQRKREAEKRQHTASSSPQTSPRRSTELERAEAKIGSLSQRVKSLEAANRSRELELEQLKTATRTLSAGDLEVEPAERAKFNDAITELSAEVARLTSDLADEASQKAKLLSLVQRQNAALGYAERQASKRIPVKRGPSDGSEIVGILRGAVDQVFPRGELGSEVQTILGNAQASPAGKTTQLLEFVKGRLNGKAEKLARSNDLLTGYVSNLLRFLDQIANSSEVQSWLIDAPPEEDFRPRVFAQLNRLTDFLNKNGISVESIPHGEGFLELPDVIIARLKQREPEAQDLLAAVQVLAEIADVSRKFAKNLQRQNDALIRDRLELQRELNHQEDTGEDVMAQIADATTELKRQLESRKAKLKDRTQILLDVWRNLKSAPPAEAVENALRLLDGEIPVTELSHAYEQLAKKHRDTEAERDEARGQIVDLQGRVERQVESVNGAIATQEDLQRQIDDRDRQIEELTAAQEKQSRREREEYQAALTELERRKNEEMIAQVGQLQDKLRAAEVHAIDEISNIQGKAKAHIRSLQKKLEIQAEKTASAEQTLETVQEELQQRVNDSTASESSAQAEIQRLETQVRELQASLSTARIDLKMLDIKLKAGEDQLKRERALAESRSHTTELSREAAHDQALSEQQSAFDRKVQTLLDSVAEPLAEFLGSSDSVSEEAVIRASSEAVEALAQARARIKELGRADSELATVRSTLGISQDRPVVAVVSQLLSKASWEPWARRMHALATDNFALAQTPEEVQSGLEEALMAGQRQSGIARKLEVLRFEKRLLVNGKVHPKGLPRKPTLRGVIMLAEALQKLQKLSGQRPAAQ